MPPVRGKLSEGKALSGLTWLRVGGPADWFFQPADAEDLAAFLAALPAEVPVFPMGVGSNLIVRDGGIAGITLRLPRSFADIAVSGQHLTVGAGAADARVARAAQEAGLTGLEFLCGIPGSIGGAVRMNAGAYGAEIGEVLDWVEAMDPSGRRHLLRRDEIAFGYRRCDLPEDWIVLAAGLRLSAAAVALPARQGTLRAEPRRRQQIQAPAGPVRRLDHPPEDVPVPRHQRDDLHPPLLPDR